MAASKFIELLESRGLLDPEIIGELYRQVEQSKVRVTPEAIAKLLVDNGQLTRFQATKLVTELNESLGSDRPDPSRALRGGRSLDPEPVNDHDSVDDLLPEEFVEAEDSVESVEVIEDGVEAVEVIENAKPVRGRGAVAELDDGPIRMVRDTKVKTKSAWESFRIIGYGFLVLLLLVFFVPLITWFWKGSADEAFDLAENAYKAQDYEKASKSFSDFAGRFPTNEHASEARVFSVLSKIRQESDKAVDPTVGSKACLEYLPTITNESAMSRFRNDVTDTLLRIAEKFILKIDNTNSIPDRKTLIDKMNEHMDLIKDPRYVGTLERTQNELRIKMIEEGQSRLVRDIQRGEDLIVTVADMTKSVEAKNVSETYDLRKKILKKYPQLESDAKLNQLLAQATAQQQELVTPAAQTLAVSNEQEPVTNTKSVVLVGRKANASETAGSTVFVRAKGAVYALNVATGQVLWRKHIGTDWTGDPKPITSAADSDVLISIPEQGKLQRLALIDGAIVWETKFAGRIIEPAIDGDDIFVSIAGGKTPSGSVSPGEVFCLDVATGQARWGKKFPQPIDVGPGGAVGKKKRYVLGNHSNLYVLSRTSGKCEEVEYIGHAPSSIAVPPIWIQNQLILFENEGADYSLMRVFQTNEEGLDIQVGQKPIRFKGHVVIAPQVDRRRIAVLTNMGEMAILEVDSFNPKDKVFKQVNSVENQPTPKLAWPLMVENDLLVASTRLALYQIQESSQKLNQQWSVNDLDQFTSRPIKADDYVIHTRVVRGNLGVRATAIKMGSGEVVWESDLGVPVTSLSTDGKGFLAVTAQGAAFPIEGKSFQAKQPIAPVQNLGRNQRSMMFVSPIKRPDSSIVIMNQALGNLLVVDPTRRMENPTKMLPLEFGDAFPASEPISLGNGSVLVPLSNGQIAMIDPDKGKLVGLPFQPILQAGERPKWLNPTVMADKQTAIVADQQRFMYRLATGKQLRSVTSQALEKPLKGRLSIIKDVIVGVSAGASGDQLDFYESSELKRFTSVPVEGRFVWGPYAIESESKGFVLALSDIDGLVACDETGKLLWSKPMEKVVLIGTPTLAESDCIVASTSGELIRVSLATGNMVARVQIGEPISGPPLILPKAMLVPCDEGLVVMLPPLNANSDSAGESR